MSGRTHQGRSVADHLEDDVERHYRLDEYAEARRTSGINIEGYMNDSKTGAYLKRHEQPNRAMDQSLTAYQEQKAEQMNRLADEAIQAKIADRAKNDPLYRAAMNGNKPSRGARIDAQIMAEEAEMLLRKKRT